jgi:hypothetical protein
VTLKDRGRSRRLGRVAGTVLRLAGAGYAMNYVFERTELFDQTSGNRYLDAGQALDGTGMSSAGISLFLPLDIHIR